VPIAELAVVDESTERIRLEARWEPSVSPPTPVPLSVEARRATASGFRGASPAALSVGQRSFGLDGVAQLILRRGRPRGGRAVRALSVAYQGVEVELLPECTGTRAAIEPAAQRLAAWLAVELVVHRDECEACDDRGWRPCACEGRPLVEVGLCLTCDGSGRKYCKRCLGGTA
jgi:hypothetical protein